MTNVTKIAGVLEVEIYVQSNISHEIVQDMFTRAIAAAVEIPVEFVTSLTASEIQHTSGAQRRLQDNVTNQTSAMDNHTKIYEVAYEVIVPSYMNASEVIEKANRIADPNSTASKLFRQVLLSTNGVVGVGKITSKVSAYIVETTTMAPSPQETKDQKRWVSILIGAIAVIFGLSCLVTTCILVRRKMAAAEATKASAPQGAKGDIENGGNLVPEGILIDLPQNVGHA